MDAAIDGAEEIYNKLSANAKEFFGNEAENLKLERHENTMFCVIFGGVITGLIFFQACLVCGLKSKRDRIVADNVEWTHEEIKKRKVYPAQHECCEFPYIKTNEDVSLEVIGLVKKEKKKRGRKS